MWVEVWHSWGASFLHPAPTSLLRMRASFRLSKGAFRWVATICEPPRRPVRGPIPVGSQWAPLSVRGQRTTTPRRPYAESSPDRAGKCRNAAPHRRARTAQGGTARRAAPGAVRMGLAPRSSRRKSPQEVHKAKRPGVRRAFLPAIACKSWWVVLGSNQ